MDRKVIKTDRAPAAIGPYSQAVQAGELVFVSGQIPLDPESGEVVSGDVRSQTRQALNNLSAVLQAAGSSLEKVVKTTIFITNMDEFSLVNEVYGEFFENRPPARSCVQVCRLPRDVAVEVEAIAVIL